MKNEICQCLGINDQRAPGLYLGLPAVWERSKVAALRFVIEKVRKKMGGWKHKFLSQAGREVLIKAVCNVVPAYAMNCFKFPKNVCMQLDGLISDFFWGKQRGEGKIHWLVWHKLTKSKFHGGMGFREFFDFNDALLAKQAWRLLCNPNELWARQLRGLYFPNGRLLEAQKGFRASWGWSSLLVGRDVLAKNLFWRHKYLEG